MKYLYPKYNNNNVRGTLLFDYVALNEQRLRVLYIKNLVSNLHSLSRSMPLKESDISFSYSSKHCTRILNSSKPVRRAFDREIKDIRQKPLYIYVLITGRNTQPSHYTHIHRDTAGKPAGRDVEGNSRLIAAHGENGRKKPPPRLTSLLTHCLPGAITLSPAPVYSFFFYSLRSSLVFFFG